MTAREPNQHHLSITKYKQTKKGVIHQSAMYEQEADTSKRKTLIMATSGSH